MGCENDSSVSKVIGYQQSQVNSSPLPVPVPGEKGVKGDPSVLIVDTVRDLKNIPDEEINKIVSREYKCVQLNGYDEVGDTPAPLFYFLTKSTAIEDLGSVFEVKGIKLKGNPDYADYFGCNDKKDSTAQFTNYVNYVWMSGRQAVILYNKSYKGDIIISDENINVLGNNSFLDGSVIIGDKSRLGIYNSTISGINFNRPEIVSGKHGIELTNVRRLLVTNCVFSNQDKAIYNTDKSNGFHANAQINVISNYFLNVNYCWYIDRVGLVGDQNAWMVNSDFKFCLNTSNVAYITHVYAKGLDGLEMISNVLFFNTSVARRGANKHHLEITDTSNFIIFNSNNLFESGEESVKLYDNKKIVINGNLFARSGQKAFYHTVSHLGVNNDGRVTVSDNTFDGFSGSCLYTNSTGSTIFNSNNIVYVNNFPNYWGSVDLSKMMHFGVDMVGRGSGLYLECNDNVLSAVAFSNNTPNFQISRREGKINNFKNLGKGAICESSFRVSASLSEGRYTLLSLSSSRMAVNYDGHINIYVRRNDEVSSNLASYSLSVNKLEGQSAEVIEISRIGKCFGTSTNDPSFYFMVQDDILLAIPLGLTSASFIFDIETKGNIQVSLNKSGDIY